MEFLNEKDSFQILDNLSNETAATEDEYYYCYVILQGKLDEVIWDDSYIGITKHPRKRWREHLHASATQSSPLYDIIRHHTCTFRLLARSTHVVDVVSFERALRNKPNMGWNRALGGMDYRYTVVGPRGGKKTRTARIDSGLTERYIEILKGYFPKAFPY